MTTRSGTVLATYTTQMSAFACLEQRDPRRIIERMNVTTHICQLSSTRASRDGHTTHYSNTMITYNLLGDPWYCILNFRHISDGLAHTGGAARKPLDPSEGYRCMGGGRVERLPHKPYRGVSACRNPSVNTPVTSQLTVLSTYFSTHLNTPNQG